MRLTPVVSISLCSCLCVCAVFAQQEITYSASAESVFREAVTNYRDGRYREAINGFDQIINGSVPTQRLTAALVMKGKALYRLNENLECAKTMRSFLAQYPGSTYAADAHLTLGRVYQGIARYEDALSEFFLAWETMPRPAPPRLSAGLFGTLDTVTSRDLAVATLERVLAGRTVAEERSFLWLKIGEREAARDNIPAAATAVDSLTLRYPQMTFRERLAALQGRITTRSSVTLGVLLPLMQKSEPSMTKEIGTEVFDGVQFAVEQYMNDPSVRVKVGLEIRDTERDPRIAIRGAQELADQRDVIGIIGPVFSNTTSAAAAVAQARGIPLVTPTANSNGIAAIGPYIFQVNADYDTRGRAMARYAVLERGFKTLAVLAPSDTYAKFLADGFVNEVDRLGAKIVAKEWYQRGTSDLKTQLASIRRAGMMLDADPLISFSGKMKPADVMKLVELGAPPRRLDSLLYKGGTMRAVALLGDRARAKLDSIGFKTTFDDSHVDSLEYPVTEIQAIYSPVTSAEEIGIVSSQIVYFHFDTQLLGSGEWDNIGELDANKRYCTGVIFESDTEVDSSSPSYSDFLRAFVARYRKSPGKNTLYGYDAAGVVLDAIRAGSSTRETLARTLAGIRNFQGLRSAIGFSPGRVNSWLQILQYNGESVRHLEEIRAE
jgi:ABC-type branched-subunit amino acid transport system substrate-binding protein